MLGGDCVRLRAVLSYTYMDSMFMTVILAIVQGATEFLPISSSAHLVLFGEMFGRPIHHPALTIVLHGATLVAIVVYFRRDICRLIPALFSRTPSKSRSVVYAVVLGTLPIVCIGFFAYSAFSSVQTVPVVAIALIVSGALLILADYCVEEAWLRNRTSLWQKGIGIGILQVFALLPGVSRSGITIAGGRLFGLSRKEATRFSFLLAIPTIIGALVLTFFRTPVTTALFHEIGFTALLVGVCVAGGIAYVAIHFFLKLVERIGFLPFFGYQIALGVTLLLLPII